MRSVYLTLAALVALVGGTLVFADDAQALGHRRAAAGCSADYADAGCAGDYRGEWRPLRRLFGFERRAARRAARQAAYAAYGCAGPQAASCAGEPAGCDAPEFDYHSAPPEPKTTVAPCPRDGAGVRVPAE